jgi:hypothetical protein
MDAATTFAPISDLESRRALHFARSAFDATLAQWVQDLLEARRLGVLDHTWARREGDAYRSAA